MESLLFGLNNILFIIRYIHAYIQTIQLTIGSDGKHSAYLKVISYFLLCNFYGLKAIPTTVNKLCLFAEFLGRSFKSVESFKNYVSGVKTLHQVSDVKFPQENFIS